jgi:hypothetical protein
VRLWVGVLGFETIAGFLYGLVFVGVGGGEVAEEDDVGVAGAGLSRHALALDAVVEIVEQRVGVGSRSLAGVVADRELLLLFALFLTSHFNEYYRA